MGGGVSLFSDVQSVMVRHKMLVTDMVWRPKIGKIDIDWVEAKMLCQFLDEYEVPQQLYVLCQWRKRQLRLPEHWTFSLFYRDQRIYAVDAQPDKRHDNVKAGRGRPMFMEVIYGSHEHTWSEEGYGYAEPISLPVAKPEVMWDMFLSRANISPADFSHPDFNEPELDFS